MHGLTEGRSVRPAVRPGEGNSPTIKPYREYVPLSQNGHCSEENHRSTNEIVSEQKNILTDILAGLEYSDNFLLFPAFIELIPKTIGNR